MEQKLDGLVARLGDSDASSQSQTPTESSSLTLLSDSAQTDGAIGSSPSNAISASQHDTGNNQAGPIETLQDLVNIHNFSDGNEDDSSFNPTGVVSPQGVENNDPGEHRDVLKDIASDPDAESLLAEYRNMACNFPFVPIPVNVNVQELHARKPMLLLAILTAATWKDRTKQTSLSERYRYELAQRAIVQPRKSLSLVQSLLVYLSW